MNKRRIQFATAIIVLTISSYCVAQNTFPFPAIGNVGIGTTNPQHLLDLGTQNGKKLAVFQNSAGDDFYGFGIETALLEFYAGAATGDLPGMVLRKISGNVGIGRSDPQTRLHVRGTTTTSVLAITGGSDLSEQFAVNISQDSDLQTSRQPIKPGMVVCIDKENPGELIVNSTAYDRTVAGIISGAGGVESGILIGQDGSIANGDTPVALTGRVYCWADASNGSIEPGDLLTTSNTYGHAMKVSDYTMAQGAILGKAMASLETGRGLVLVLVTLQ